MAGDVLRGALLGGLPLARPARLRHVGRGDGVRRHPGRDARGRRARPSRRRIPSTTVRSWSTSAPTPSRRCSRWWRPVLPTTTSWCTPTSWRRRRGGDAPAARAEPRCVDARRQGGRVRPGATPSHLVGAGGEQGRRAGPGGRALQPPGLQHLLPGRRTRPTRTSASAASPSSSTSSRRRWSR